MNSENTIPSDEQGFTLSEMLLVLSIFMLIVSLSLGFLPSFSKSMENRLFMNQMMDDLHYVQHYAMTHNMKTTFSIDLKNKEYYGSTDYKQKKLVKRSIPSDIKIEKGSMNLEISFYQKGSPNLSGTWIIRTKSSVNTLTIYLGSGRMKIEKL
ncbi:competence type IV pilus minor pilin ComGD [Peribacillus loiseleuriae]|uniref:competence type IV pilus minor pilin ComGD n=1 Tax=Peribacillus loiseleuriae TaxID=1679170 RepID=UPI003D03E46D